jgi:hypothetical protein
MFRFSSRRIPSILIASLFGVALLATARPALAGPPLLCHPFDIGSARSLPWDGTQWWQGRADYALQSLVADTEALLTPATPVIVRMETLRRAALYASQDTQVATQLLAALTRRTKDAAATGANGRSMALFDAGYLAETFRQIGHLGQMAQFRTRAQAMAAVAAGAEGHALVSRSIALRPEDPSLQFAAALISADRDRGAYQQHAAKARQGAAQDALLARNLHQIS